MLTLSGIGVSQGIALGCAHVIGDEGYHVPQNYVKKDQLTYEIRRYKNALKMAKQQLTQIRDQIPEDSPEDILNCLDAYLMMLDDTALSLNPIDLIKNQQCNAEWALQQQYEALTNFFETMEDEYLRMRKDDVHHLTRRLQRILRCDSLEQLDGQLIPMNNQTPYIIIAEDLSPADAILLFSQGCKAFVTERGGPTSHTAIIARSLNIPTIVGVHHIRRLVKEATPLVIDGSQGLLIIAPDSNIFQYYQSRQSAHKERELYYQRLKNLPTASEDGYLITLRANVELQGDIKLAQSVNADGVGLYRTENLFLNKSEFPDEHAQLKAYLHLVRSMRHQLVTIRSIDLGNDKQAALPQHFYDQEINPALGMRGIRLCLRDQSLFRPQLRAILQASAFGHVRLLLPMLSMPEEIQQVLEIVEEIKRELFEKGIAYDPNLPIGGMIETPAAAIAADLFAEHLDFLSIGTNDLIQYTLAIDRSNDNVNYLYDPLHPAVLRLIRMVIRAGERAHIPVSLCGEMAGDPRYTQLLLGLGLREFSLRPASLLEVKNVICHSNIHQLSEAAQKLINSHHTIQFKNRLGQINQHLE
jgi:phosphoenolpyruvate-protein phosphotransferase (PTS system enzyme I)